MAKTGVGSGVIMNGNTVDSNSEGHEMNNCQLFMTEGQREQLMPIQGRIGIHPCSGLDPD